MRPDTISIMCTLSACGRQAFVRFVRQCHCYVIRASIHDLHLDGALVNSYSKCGGIKNAHRIFRASSHKDLIIFTAMVWGYAMPGMVKEALSTLLDMMPLDIKPDHDILTSLLSACSHAGLVDEGWKHFKSMSEIHGIEPTLEHYACMADLLAHSGRLREAYDFITGMPCGVNAHVWGTLLGVCKIHGDAKIGRLVANHLFDVEDQNIGNYVLMSNIYAAVGRWDGVEKVPKMLKTKDLKKPTGCSWIQGEMTRHVFL